MNDHIYTEEKAGLVLKIFPDTDCQESPSEWGDNNIFLVGYHQEFYVEGPTAIIPEHLRVVTHKSYCTSCYQRNFTTIEETGTKCGKCGLETRVNRNYYRTSKGRPFVTKEDCQAFVNKEKDYDLSFFKKYHVFGLEAYIHSGVVLALSNEGNFCDRSWDVSQVGLVFISREEFKRRDRARKMALGHIETWNDYLSGSVYGYSIEDQEGNSFDSCGGFYGDYEKYCLPEARASLKRYIEEAQQIIPCLLS